MIISSSAQNMQVGRELFRSLTARGSRAVLMYLPEVLLTEDRLPTAVITAMKQTDVLFIYTQRSFPPHAHEAAVKAGARCVSFCGATDATLLRAARTDYERLARLTDEAAACLRKAGKVHLGASGGTDLYAEVETVEPLHFTGLARKRGESTALPAGVVATALVPGTAKGKVVIDGSVQSIGQLAAPITCTVKDGKLSRIEGGREAAQLEALLGRGDDKASLLAEIGFGTNPTAAFIGDPLEDERVLGFCHVGFGRSAHLGGKIICNMHIDAVIRAAEVRAGGKNLLQEAEAAL
jgi:leucyl aminopeptidase (aminopeptidase T)